MSYQRPDTGNSMNDFFSALSDFLRLSPGLLDAGTPEDFAARLDEVILIDRRSTVLFLEKHREEIPPEHWRYARQQLGQYLKD